MPYTATHPSYTAHRAQEDAHFRAECRATADKIADDLQALMSLAEEIAQRWAEDGLLDMKRGDNRFNQDTHQWEVRTVLLPKPVAVARLLGELRETLEERLSASAREAQEVAGA